jgi:hypothetical protein
MNSKEAVIKLHTYMQYDPKKLTEQQAIDKLEEILNELEEQHGISINIHERYTQENPN